MWVYSGKNCEILTLNTAYLGKIKEKKHENYGRKVKV